MRGVVIGMHITRENLRERENSIILGNLNQQELKIICEKGEKETPTLKIVIVN